MRCASTVIFVLCLGLAVGLTPSAAWASTPASAGSAAGTALADAVVINVNDDDAAIKAEDKWIAKHYPGYRKVNQALLVKHGHHYDAIKIQNAQGKEKTIYFDVSKAFNALMNLFGGSN